MKTAIGLLCLLARIACVQAADIVAYAEEWPPYNFSEKGMVRGIATDLLDAACRKAELVCDIKIVPWARGYKLAQSQPNTLIFTTARTAERESQFIWIGPILPRETWIFGRPDSPKIRRIADLANYTVAVVAEDASLTDLQQQGVPAKAMDMSSRDQDSLRKFAAHRVDFITGTEVGLAWGMRSYKLDVPLVKTLRLSNKGGYYYALNPGSDPISAKRLQRAVTELVQSGERDRIVSRYTGH